MSRCKAPQQATVLALAAVLTVAIAACGGGDDEPEPTDSVLSDASSEQTVPPLDAGALAAPGEEESLSSLAEEERPEAGGNTLEPGSGTATLGSATDYTIQAGDTLWEIAARFETTVEVLVALNGLVNAGALDVGQVILLPASEVESEEAAPADGEAEAGEPDGAASGDEDGNGSPSETGDGEAGDGGAGVSPDTIPQPDPDVTVSEIPDRPADFGAFGAAALPWLHGRTEVSEILPLFEAWSMPSVAGSDRLHLVDSDLDGLFSILIVYTDPASFSTPLTVSNLVIYDPIPDRPERYRMAYDHRLRSELESSNIIVRLVQDVTGDGRRDVTFTEEFCGAHTCTTSLHVLVRSGDGYRDAVIAPVDIPTATSFETADRTGDGLPDITIEGGTFGSVGAGPPRPYRYLFSAAGGTVRQVEQVGLPSSWRVWVVIDANEAFAAGAYAAALALYEQALTDESLTEWSAGGSAELWALSHLRQALAQALLGDATAATRSAQAAAAESGLVAQLSNAFLGGFAAEAEVGVGCAAFNNALALRVAEWDNFWSRYGYGVPPFPAEDVCPF